MKNFVNGCFGQLRADEQDQGCDGQAGEILDPGVPVGVRCVGGLLRQAEADKGDDGAGGVREVVDGVRRDGNRACQQADQELGEKQQQIAADADQPCHFAAG